MKIINNKKGSSLIEVLIYIAILAIIGTILVGYFMVAITSEKEHSVRSSVMTSVQNITSSINYDLGRTSIVGIPENNFATSSILEIKTDSGVVRYKVDSDNNLIKEISTTTVVLTDQVSKVDNIVFRRIDHFEERLSATTTSIDLILSVSDRQSGKIKRDTEISFLVGKDTI